MNRDDCERIGELGRPVMINIDTGKETPIRHVYGENIATTGMRDHKDGVVTINMINRVDVTIRVSGAEKTFKDMRIELTKDRLLRFEHNPKWTLDPSDPTTGA